jgi:chromosome segregation ATPase
MAQEIVGVKIQVESNASEGVGSLRKQLKEAQAEVQTLADKFGATSEQAVAAAKKAAELKDRIGDAKALTDAFNPDRKFQAFASALTGVVGGISAVQGAMGLLGVENEEVEKTLLKVNSAMALSQGLNSILEARDSFKNLGTVIQSTAIFQKANNAATVVAIALQKAFGVATIGTGRAFTILKGAIAATGIGLLVVGLTTLISKISEWTSTTDKAAEAQKKLAEQTDLINSKLENEIAILTSLGNKEKEIFDKRIEQTNNELNTLRKRYEEKKGLTIEEAKRFGELKTKLITLELDEKNRVKKINEDAQKEKDKKDKEASDKAKAVAKERTDANVQAEDELRKIRQQAELDLIKDENQKAIKKAEFDFTNRKIEIDGLKASEKLKTELLVEAQKDRDKQIADAKKLASEAELTAIVDQLFKESEIDLAEAERQKAIQQKELDDLFAQLDAENESERKAAEAQKEIEKEKSDFKKQQLNEVGDALTKLGDIVGKETAAGKALGIATALINTYQGATEALKQKSTLPSPFDFAAKAINVAAIIASGIKSVKAITAVKVPGGGGGQSAPVTSLTAGTSAPISPNLPIQATLTQLNQSSINQLGSATNRAYVVESDVTNSQERIRRINRAARLN